VRDGELPLAQLILGERRVALPRVDVKLHEPAVRRLDARHQRNPAARGGERRFSLDGRSRRIECCTLGAARDDAIENRLRNLPKTHALAMQPVVVLGCRAGLECRQEVATIEIDGILETLEALFAREPLEARDVERLHRGHHAHRFPVDGKTRRERRRESMQCRAQIGA
jgi:hypothetical protein